MGTKGIMEYPKSTHGCDRSNIIMMVNTRGVFKLKCVSSSSAEGFHPDEQWRSCFCVHSSIGDCQGQCEMAQSLQGAVLPMAEEIT